MTLTYFLNIVPGYPFLTILIWFLVAVAMLYFARYPAHRTIRSLSRVLHNSMRLASRSVLLAEKQIIERNKEVLIAMGREATERVIEREFLRVDAVVKRDLNGYPSLQHKLAEQISRIDEDYRESAEVPPPAPTWVGTVKALTKIPFNGDQTLVNVFKEIQKTIAKQYKNTIDEYRKSTSARHTLLKQMMPYWRKLTQTLDQVGKKITGLQERATVIDKKMEGFPACTAANI